MDIFSVGLCDMQGLNPGLVSSPAITDVVEEDTVVTVTCLIASRHVLIGYQQITCQNNGDWSQQPECRKTGNVMI